MAEYIEREALLNEARKRAKAFSSVLIYEAIKEAPTADVEKVVYCKECKHLYCCSAVDRQFYCRHIHGMKGCLNPIEENPFCSYGVRKEE